MEKFSLLVLVSLISSFGVFFLFSLALGQKRQSRVRTTFARFACCQFLVVFFEFLSRLPFQFEIENVFLHISFFVFYFGGFLYLHFVYALVERKSDAYLKVLFAVAAAGSITTLLPESIHQVIYRKGQQSIGMPASIQSFIIFAAVLFPTAYAVAIQIKHLRKPENERQRRILKLLVAGTAITLAIAFFVLVVTPLVLPFKEVVYQFSPLSMLILCAFMNRAVSKYHFLGVSYDEIEEVSKSLFENLSDAIVVIGASGEVVQTNSPARALLGCQLTVAKIRSKVDVYHPDLTCDGWRTTVHSQNGERNVLISQSRIQKSGLPLGKLLILRDITKQAQLEAERARMEARIQQSEKLKAIGQLAGGVAHDFNNQLAGIIGFADLIKQRVRGDPQLAGWVDNLLTAAQRGAELTAQLLAYARKGKYLSVAVDLHEVIAEVASLLEHVVDKRIKITKQLGAANSIVRGDQSQLQNALLNLGLNARDAMPQGGELTFATENATLHDQNIRDSTGDIQIGTQLLVRVSDTGVGMPEEVQQHIFEPFFTTKEDGKGTGMGLAAVYGTIRSHRGKIGVKSAPGQGSAFEICLPVDLKTTLEKDVQETHDEIVRGAGLILLVDDEAVVLQTTELILRDLGYRVMTCADGAEALDVYRESWREIDLVILDLVLPKMNGKQIFEEIRSINPDAAVLLCSGYSVDGRAQEVLKAGALGFIPKPFRIANLSEKVAEAMARRQA